MAKEKSKKKLGMTTLIFIGYSLVHLPVLFCITLFRADT